ncbi:hypothetical protein [Antarcticirhabdus aurantiaca]|uniref:Uncharacterized protein n=1 Tax=Antarcticirhabdus aurantiaca TaxID=2606717 RepID=A0ACD4NT43_9HYPH|nr:hypothetical protein [Antarcticirhabdus aurantiaca]WAJ29928.1 hypothetical protein OXU80_06860 [Jeongeuplla avenae]
MSDIEAHLQALEARSLQTVAANHALKVMLQHLWLDRLRSAGGPSAEQTRVIMDKFTAVQGDDVPAMGGGQSVEQAAELRAEVQAQFTILANEMVLMANRLAEHDAEREMAEDEAA